jgi:hypothetical protein
MPVFRLPLARFLRRAEVESVPLDDKLARSCGELCSATNSRDVIDASVVILTRERRDPIATSDPNDLRHLDPAAQIIPVHDARGVFHLDRVGLCQVSEKAT